MNIKPQHWKRYSGISSLLYFIFSIGVFARSSRTGLDLLELAVLAAVWLWVIILITNAKRKNEPVDYRTITLLTGLMNFCVVSAIVLAIILLNLGVL